MVREDHVTVTEEKPTTTIKTISTSVGRERGLGYLSLSRLLHHSILQSSIFLPQKS